MKQGREGLRLATSRLRRKELKQQLRSSLDAEAFLRDVIGARNITQQRDEWVHSCPLPWGLHRNNDEAASASFNSDRLKFNCFVCGGGDIFWYVRNALDVDQAEAFELLSTSFRPREQSAEEFIHDLEELWAGEDVVFSIPEYSPKILEPWMRYVPYFDDRGISRETQMSMSTGIDLRHQDFYKSKLEEGWLTQPRVVIPHFYRRKLVGWVKRKVASDQFGPKYKNSAGFPKNESLYNFDKTQIDWPVFVVESPMSVLHMISQGEKNVVATFGSKVTDEQVELLRVYDDVFLFFDEDEEGNRATERVRERLDRFTRVWVCTSPQGEGSDPGDLSASEIAQSIQEKVPATIWKMS